jgi:hypothetical protein
MKAQDIYIAHPQTNDQVSALKAFMQALKIKFEVAKEESYNPDFVNKIKESREQAKKTQVTRVDKENLKSFLGL